MNFERIFDHNMMVIDKNLVRLNSDVFKNRQKIDEIHKMFKKQKRTNWEIALVAGGLTVIAIGLNQMVCEQNLKIKELEEEIKNLKSREELKDWEI